MPTMHRLTRFGFESFSYEINLLNNENIKSTLIQYIRTFQEAVRIEKELEQKLGIEDRPIRREGSILLSD